MKIYQVNVTARFSTGNIIKQIDDALRDRSDEVRFAYGFGGQAEENSLQLSGIWRLRIDARLERVFGREGAVASYATKKLIKDIKKFDPDVIHLHNLHGNYISVGRLFKFLAKYNKPVVYTLHDCWSITGGCTHFTTNGCYKWKTECFECKYQSVYLLRKLFPVEKKEFNKKRNLLLAIKNLHITTVSSWLKDITLNSFLSSKDVRVVYNGIDTQIFKVKDVSDLRERLKTEGKYVVLGVASSWGERKGLLKWYNLSEALDENYKIVLVGLNKQQIANAPKNIIALPRTSTMEELADLYNLADVFVNMSFEETFGLTTAESMACGTPVIVMNSTANPELVNDKVGIVIDNYSEDALINSIEVLCKRKEIMKNDCVFQAVNKFSVDKMTSGYLELYDEITERK